MPLVRGELDQVNEEVFSEVTYHAAYEPKRCVRTARYKYIRRYEGARKVVLPNCDDSPSKDIWMESNWQQRTLPEEALYDLLFDPNEACNRADDPDYAGPLEEMRERLDAWMERTSDPLLVGCVPAPRGAQVNDPEGTSPREECIVVE